MANNKQKKTQRKAGRRRGPRVSPFGTAPLLPANRVAKLAYSEVVTITEPTAAAGGTYSFSLNSLFDPNSGGVGLQPVGFDQIMAMYGQYRVLSANVKLTAANQGNVNTLVGMFGTFQPASPANPNAWSCQPYGVFRTVEPTGGRSTAVLTKRFDIPAVLGLKKSQYLNDMDFVGSVAGNPTRQAYLILWIRSLTATVTAAFLHVQVEYTVQFSQPQALGMS